MNHEEFRWLVQRLETRSARSPRAFQHKVLLISLAAYAALLVGLLVNGALLYGAVAYALKHGVNRLVVIAGILGLMSVPIFFVIVRVLTTRIPAPNGRMIERGDAPVLFDLLDKMRSKLDGPKVHHVLIDKEYNACIVQRPRWGLVGPSVNYLVLGFPFLHGQSTSEMLAVVAHEYGHLCGAHGRIAAWVHRQRLIFTEVHARVARAANASTWYGLLLKPLDAFMPYFHAYVFVLSRQHEYEADRAAATLTGPETASASLIRVSLLAEWFTSRYWPTLYRHADTREAPPVLPYKSLATAFRMSHDEWATAGHLSNAWRRDSDVADTHPCLRERVEALGQQAALPRPLAINAAMTLLGALGDRLADEFDREWWHEQAGPWGERHRRATRAHARLGELGAMPLDTLPLHDMHEMAVLKAEFESPASAKPVFEHLLRQPGGPFPKAAFAYGQILLDEGNRAGLDHLADAARHDRRIADDALRMGFHFIFEREGEVQAHQWVGAISEAQAA